MKIFCTFALITLTIFSSGCSRRNSNDVWDDTQSCGRYMNQGLRKLGGKQGDSRQVRSREDFNRYSIAPCLEDEFTPLQDEQGHNMISMDTVPPAFSPGDRGSSVPGIEAFSDPDQNQQLASTFSHIHFLYDSDVVQGQDNLQRVQKLASYLKNHPDMYVFLEGHCDERGPQAYNLALGTRRANAVRTILIAEGVNGDRLFTISYGKERPLVTGNSESIWSKNRRVQFKTWEQ